MRTPEESRRRWLLVFACGASVGVLGGLIGLGGAEFRLPLLIAVFGFAALESVILNKATSLIVVAASLPFRAAAVPFTAIGDHWHVLAILLPGTLAGAWLGASFATRLRTPTLYRVLALLLVLIAGVLLLAHDATPTAPLHGAAQASIGIALGLGIGFVAAIMGVAGGELLIPTIVLLFAVDVKLAGSLSLAVSLPTMLVSFARYSRDRSFSVIRRHGVFLSVLAFSSVLGAFAGGQLLGVVPSSVLLPGLAAILVLSAIKVWRHR